jgi:metallophosphoesterase superfamily enzyme
MDITSQVLFEHGKRGFSVPAFASRASARQAVFPAAASLQTGFPLRSNTFQFIFFFLTPDTWCLLN